MYNLLYDSGFDILHESQKVNEVGHELNHFDPCLRRLNLVFPRDIDLSMR